MRFRRRPRIDGLRFSNRKAVAFERRKQREQDRLPLFAAEIAASQISWEQEQTRREMLSFKTEQEWRSRIASWWRKGRALYFAEPIETRKKIMDAWRAWAGPTDATYFIYIVELHNGTIAARAEAMKAAGLAARQRAVVELQAGQTIPLRLEK